MENQSPTMKAILDAGYAYELAGLIYYVFFLMMARGKNAQRYSLRSRVLVVAAALALVGSVPFHYATTTSGVTIMFVLALVALASAFVDARRPAQ
jgi:hypothetical protein